MKYLILFFTISFTILSFGQSKVMGIVTYENYPISQASISVDEIKNVAKTDINGQFVIELSAGSHKIKIDANGYKSYYTNLNLKDGEIKKISFQILKMEKSIDEVKINKISTVKLIKELPFNVVAIDAKAYYNTTLDLAHLLDKTSGIKIRESGGLGSNTNITLNGFTGNNVKIFMDGVPMQGFGSSFQLNNIPVGVADYIEVYKGVVPIEYGADAMGGVINIVTNQSQKTYLDFSASYGSFNTQKTNVNAGYTSKSGFTAQINAYQNSSDNDYKVKTEVKNLITGVTPLGEYHWVKRFNDAYHNDALVVKAGFVKKKWADRLLLGASLGNEYAEIQQGYRMTVVFGERNRKANSRLYSLNYEKRDLFLKGLNVKLNANLNSTNNSIYDTINKSYNWFGKYIYKNTKGEYGNPTLSKFVNKNKSVTSNISYHINAQHSFEISDVLTTYKRDNRNDAAIDDPDNLQDNITRKSTKNIIGVSYRYTSLNRKWMTNIFGKQYNLFVDGPINIGDAAHPVYQSTSKDYNISGYGIASTYNLKKWQLKASFEKAYRLPTDTELFGDEILEIGSASIKAEESLNYNLGISFNKDISKNSNLYIDANFFYRDTYDFIRRVVDQREGGLQNENWGNVKNIGIDAEVKYNYKNIFSFGGALTYQNIRNYEKYSKSNSSQESVSYLDRMPNIPYFFGNADATYYIHDLWAKGNNLSVAYTFNFLNQFYLNWPSLGSSSSKDQIPTQIWNDLSFTYSMKGGRYNISLEALNINNALLYDNFYNQKPGRRFAIKFRFYISSNKKQ